MLILINDWIPNIQYRKWSNKWWYGLGLDSGSHGKIQDTIGTFITRQKTWEESKGSKNTFLLAASMKKP